MFIMNVIAMGIITSNAALKGEKGDQGDKKRRSW